MGKTVTIAAVITLAIAGLFAYGFVHNTDLTAYISFGIVGAVAMFACVMLIILGLQGKLEE